VTRRLSVVLLFGLVCVRAPRAEGGLLPDGHLDTAAVRDAYLRADMPFVRAALEGFAKNHPREVGTGEKVFTHLYLGAIYAGEADGRAKAEARFRAALKLDPYCDPANLYLPPATKTWFERLRADVLRAQAQAEPPPASAAASSASQGKPSPRSAPALPRPPAPAAAPSPRHPDYAAELPRETSAAYTDDRIRVSPAGPADPAMPKAEPGSDPGTDRASAGSDAADGRGAESSSRGWLWWSLGGTAAIGAGALAWFELEPKPKPNRVEVDATLK
jgi:hypothetical protein